MTTAAVVLLLYISICTQVAVNVLRVGGPQGVGYRNCISAVALFAPVSSSERYWWRQGLTKPEAGSGQGLN